MNWAVVLTEQGMEYCWVFPSKEKAKEFYDNKMKELDMEPFYSEWDDADEEFCNTHCFSQMDRQMFMVKVSEE